MLSPHGNARYFFDDNRPLWYIFLRYSATTVMYGIFYILYFLGNFRVRVVLRGQYVHRTRKSPDLKLKYEICCVCVFFSHLFWTSNSLEVPAGVTQDFSSTFLLRFVPLFFSREGFSRFFPSSTVKTNLCTTNDLIVLHLLGIFFFFFLF